MTLQEQIIKRARTCLGTPFHHQGRLPGVGIDCIGLLVHASAVLENPLKDNINYGRYPDGKTLMTALYEQLDEIEIEDVQIGDILVFQFRRFPTHVGIKTDKGVIHTWTTVEKVVEHNLDKWRKRICNVFRFRGI